MAKVIFNGTKEDDSFVGGNGADVFYGAGGNDTLVGGAGNDLLRGGAGADYMEGGSGNDIYFARGDDTIKVGEGHDLIGFGNVPAKEPKGDVTLIGFTNACAAFDFGGLAATYNSVDNTWTVGNMTIHSGDGNSLAPPV